MIKLRVKYILVLTRVKFRSYRRKIVKLMMMMKTKGKRKIKIVVNNMMITMMMMMLCLRTNKTKNKNKTIKKTTHLNYHPTHTQTTSANKNNTT